MQAARGASLTSSSPEQPPAETPPVRAALAFVVAVVALVVDTVTKVLAVHHLQDRAPVQLLGHWVQLTFARNPGAAFSTGTGYTPVITVVAIVAAVVVIWFVLRVRSLGWAWAFGFLLAGILGNLADRMFRPPGPFRGHVVDFIEFPHWPVFNVADICINVAAVLILVQVVRGVHLDGSREARHG
ncbi:signal peptidase II [Nocardioides terrisoli]|uniref:signal peptidase II n=1 Tax=Nocardioides terrisoli TaxID=3388267 RepID=UPI00287BB390|nr:signal peptidase II [Nocardioides marmorisolisilvae]